VNIGWVSHGLPYLPSRGGFRLYGANLIRQLAPRHRIDLVALLVGDDADHLEWPRTYCASIQTIRTTSQSLPKRLTNALSGQLMGRSLHYHQHLNAMLRKGIAERRWDVIHVEGGFAGGLVDSVLPIAKVLSLHDSWTLRCAEMLKCAQSLRERVYYTYLSYYEPRFERLLYPRYERCTVVAQPDLDAVTATAPKAYVDLIPYGTDTEYFHPIDVAKEDNTLVFHSHLGYGPNIESAAELANEILPRVRRVMPKASLHLIGAAPVRKVRELAQRPGIRLSADLPDLRRAVCSGRVYTSAIRYGTGLKSKILEAMAMRLPVIGYPGSAVGIACEHGKEMLIPQDPDDFAQHVIRLLRDRGESERLAVAARCLVERHYGWESRAQQYEELYRRVILERESRRRSPVEKMSSAVEQSATSN
jgi:polysaccharide biosynthesis protein PslH